MCVEVAGEVVGARDVREERTCFEQRTDRTTGSRGNERMMAEILERERKREKLR